MPSAAQCASPNDGARGVAGKRRGRTSTVRINRELQHQSSLEARLADERPRVAAFDSPGATAMLRR